MSNNCRRCHRPIVNPTSVQHGFGPVCWNKLNAQDYNERPMMFRITITDQKEASKSLARVREVVGTALKNGGVRTSCMNCGEPLRPENIEYYDHPGGYDLPGFGQKQWLYHHCEGKKKDGKKCNHDQSLWKLRIPELANAEKAVV